MRRGSCLYSHAYMMNTRASRELFAVCLQPQNLALRRVRLHLTFIWMVANSAEAGAVNEAHSRGLYGSSMQLRFSGRADSTTANNTIRSILSSKMSEVAIVSRSRETCASTPTEILQIAIDGPLSRARSRISVE